MTDFNREFHKVFRERVELATGRRDAIGWLAEQVKMSYAHVSRILNGRTPRRSSDGYAFVGWRKICQHLSPEEIDLLEPERVASVPSASVTYPAPQLTSRKPAAKRAKAGGRRRG